MPRGFYISRYNPLGLPAEGVRGMGMPKRTEIAFRGFSQRALEFLRNLGADNSKAWFEEHRGEYDEYLLEPMKMLVEALAPAVLAIDPHLDVRPRVDKTISRIHRDTRFSKDKSPYRNFAWIAFKRDVKDWSDCPGFFMEFSPAAYRYGMGFYRASKKTMDGLRRLIDRDPRAFRETIELLDSASFRLEGESYKRILNPKMTGTLLDWYQKKNCYVARNKKIDDIFFSPALVAELSDSFGLLAPIYRILALARDS